VPVAGAFGSSSGGPAGAGVASGSRMAKGAVASTASTFGSPSTSCRAKWASSELATATPIWS
jgi:hypothetical protein